MKPTSKWLLLAPTLLVLGGFFVGAILFTLAVGLQFYPNFDASQIRLTAFIATLTDEASGPSLVWTLYLALASTALATVLGVLLAWMLLHIRTPSIHLLARAPILVPHLVASLMMLAPTGLLSRAASNLGWISSDQSFPILVQDPIGVGVILTYAWKEAPFIALVALTAFRSIDEGLLQQARSLGASEWPILRHVQLPLLRPSLAAAGILVLAFTFGSYEIPALLDRISPGTLSVLAVRRFTNPADLNMDWPEAMAAACLMSLVGIILAFLYLKILERTQRARWT
jgi:putative spermidine/putrescine transport system permease protein